MAKTVGGWLNLPGKGRSASFVHGSEHNDRKEILVASGEEPRHGHSSTTGTFTDKNCPMCKGK
jgi:hypothetical protein